MAFGDGGSDEQLRDAWHAFCDRLRDAGDHAFKDRNPASDLQRADGFRFLTQNLGQAFDLALETRDPRFPQLHAFCHPTRKLGGDCADFTYHQAWIDGDSTYRISGTRGDAPFLNVTVQGPRRDGPGVLHDPFGDVPEASLTGADLSVATDGTIEVFVGGPAREGNWLPTTPGSRKLFIRQGFDRWDETPARLSVERVDMDGPRPLPTPGTMIDAIDWAGTFVTGLMTDWPEFPFAHGGVDEDHPNAFPPLTSEDGDALRGRAAVNMHWVLGPDEALIVEFDAHDGLWMLTNMGAFFTSMDYLYRPVGFTPSRTAVDSDGRIRVVLAHDDPGLHNWMDTQGFERGNLTYRHMLGGHPVPLHTRLVRRADLAAALPADTRTVTPDERSALTRQRFDGIRLRFGL
ncbi:DUF1214 domain-containing protein [Mycolicibacterium sediminis]|uniref:DUF1214 domain-containing protein n=1 Tax=Mycolicibacterium sediminis TaxID=1286180 RepID=A0A7I7QJS0_9MYCO|nr:DUF1214 domain-containing protein [Mycolicibacterium sediminis]BBY26514.1 hypothetical protein MSEDJ_06100 [Mycolicibacterium sediminis]